MKTALLLFLFSLGLPATTAAEDPFRYDASSALGISEKGSAKNGTAVVHDISFSDVAGQRMQAYLVVPQGKGPFPGVLYVHWLGDPETSNRSQFLGEAEDLAQHGAICLLVDMPWSKLHWFRDRKMADDHDFSRRQVKNLRRALDVLTQRADVDPKRIAYVGHDFGATYGAMLVGVDSRVRYAILMAGTPILSDWFLLGSKIEGMPRQAYIKKMAPLDPINYVGRARSVPILFQFATHDEYVTKEKAELFANSASSPKEVRWYETEHPLNAKAATERKKWLGSKLGLNGK